MRSRPQTGIDADLLQADVMRFMAIIAFCLIAILALVRNVDAPPVAATSVEPEPPAAPVAEPKTLTPSAQLPASRTPTPKSTPKLTPTPKAKAKPSIPEIPAIALERLAPPKPKLQEPKLLEPIVPAPPPEPLAKIEAEPLTPLPTHAAEEPIPLPEPTLAPVVAAAPPAPAEPTPVAEPAPAPSEEETLSLRFVSDRDFLRLLSKRDIEVFLFDEQSAYLLSPSYEFVAAEPPTKLYEVLPTTIPSAISSAAGRTLGDHTGYRWGLNIPGAIERQITDHLSAVNSGELVIDRFGKVHHVPAS